MNLRIDVKFSKVPELNKILSVLDNGEVTIKAKLDPTTETQEAKIRNLMHQAVCTSLLEEGQHRDEQIQEIIDDFIKTY